MGHSINRHWLAYWLPIGIMGNRNPWKLMIEQCNKVIGVALGKLVGVSLIMERNYDSPRIAVKG